MLNIQYDRNYAHVISLDNATWDSLDELLKCEEALWRDKAKTRWLEEGDSNTHLFHISTLIH